MTKTKHRVLSLVMALVMMFTLLPATVSWAFHSTKLWIFILSCKFFVFFLAEGSLSPCRQQKVGLQENSERATFDRPLVLKTYLSIIVST